jgi:accessory gene regulator protein AgrB
MTVTLAVTLLRSKQSGLHHSTMKAALLSVLTFAFCLFTFDFRVSG